MVISRLSVCRCGFPLFNENVRLGDQYQVEPEIKDKDCHVECGGCGQLIPSVFVWVHAKGNADAGWMPMEIFSDHDPAMEITA